MICLKTYHFLCLAHVQIHLPQKNCHIKIARADAKSRSVLVLRRLASDWFRAGVVRIF